jgi:alcohol dehydrogenase class IV
MAHALGAVLHIPHGRANAILLPKTIEYNARSPEVEKKLGVLCAELNFGTGKDGRCSSALIDKIYALMAACEMPFTMRDAGAKLEDYSAKIPELARRAMADACTPGNPVTPTYEDIIDLFVKAF